MIRVEFLKPVPPNMIGDIATIPDSSFANLYAMKAVRPAPAEEVTRAAASGDPLATIGGAQAGYWPPIPADSAFQHAPAEIMPPQQETRASAPEMFSQPIAGLRGEPATRIEPGEDGQGVRVLRGEAAREAREAELQRAFKGSGAVDPRNLPGFVSKPGETDPNLVRPSEAAAAAADRQTSTAAGGPGIIAPDVAKEERGEEVRERDVTEGQEGGASTSAASGGTTTGTDGGGSKAVRQGDAGGGRHADKPADRGGKK